MITFLSLVTSVKDYIEIAHKLIESSNSSQNIVSLKNYTELGAIITYVIISIKQLFLQFITLNWLQNVYSLPIMVPDIASAMLSEISVLDGFFHNAFTFLDAPLSYGNQNVTVYGVEKFFIGFINSFFLFLPTSTAHIITLRRFVMQGLEAGYIAGLGTIAGNILWLCSIIFGWRFFVIPWLSFDIFRYILGFMLLIKYMWDSSKERRVVVEDLSKYKIFMLNFLLALTEQTCIYPFINNLSIAPEASVLESFAANNLIQFIFIHSAYIFGILVGSLSLLKFTCWFWENPAFSFYMWVISAERSFFKQPFSIKSGSGKKVRGDPDRAQNNAIFGFNLQTSSYYKILNFIFMYLTMVCAISSFTYFGLDYTVTNPLGFIPQDRVIDQKALNQNLSSAQSLNEKLIPETSFLSVNPTDKSRRTRDGVRARRERWKDPLIKYQVLDPSVQDQGVYNFLTIEDLNYGFDRFWLRRKMRNHKINFRLVPGPFMRSLKKQLNKNNLADPNNSKGVEFFRLLFEQYYHPSFHKSVVSSKLNNLSSIKTKYARSADIISIGDKGPGGPGPAEKQSAGGSLSLSPAFIEGLPLPVKIGGRDRLPEKSIEMPYKRDIFSKEAYSNQSPFVVNPEGKKQSALFLNFKLSRAEINQYSALRKFTRNMQTRINLSKVGKPAAFLPDYVLFVKKRTYNLPPTKALGATITNFFNTQKNPFIYSKKWKSLYSKIWHNTSPSNNKSVTTTLDVPLFRNVFRKILSKKPFIDTAQKGRLSSSAIEEKNFFLSPVGGRGENVGTDVTHSKSTQEKIGVLSLGTELGGTPLGGPFKHEKNASIWQSSKKTMIREKLSKKDRQILRYRTLLLRRSQLNAFPSEKGKVGEGIGAEGEIAKPLEVFEKLAKPSLQAQTMLHPLKFYLQKQQAFARKYKFYGTTVFRKLSVGNNAPYFKTMMKRFFYYYKPTLRWKRTINMASLGSGSQEGFRKKSRIAKKLLSLEKPLADSKGNVQKIVSPYRSIDTFAEGTPKEEEISTKEKFTNIWWGRLWGDRTSKRGAPLVISAIEKPTHSYSVLGKQASRYRYQIYRDVLQHWYYTPFNRLLLKFDIDAFMSRQPKSHFITKKEEHLLHVRRFLLYQHFDSVRWYTYMQHYSSMKNNIGGSKSFASKVYNQQFQGTFKKVRHLFAITPSQAFSLEGKANKVYNTLDIQTKKTLRQLTPGLSNNKAILKFDQPLFNEFSNSSKVSIVNSSVTHEELLKPSKVYKSGPEHAQSAYYAHSARTGPLSPMEMIGTGRFPRTGGTQTGSQKEGEKSGGTQTGEGKKGAIEEAIKEDFISQSSNLVGQSYNEALKEKKEVLTKLVQDKNYWQFTQFLFKGLDTLESGLNLEWFHALDTLETVNSPSLNSSKNGANTSRQVMANSRGGPQELWVKLLKENKRRVYDREFLKNYITHRIDKKNQQIQDQQTLLKNRLLRLKRMLSPTTLQEQNPTHAKAYASTGVQKALKDSFLLLRAPRENLGAPPFSFHSFNTSMAPTLEEVLALNLKVQQNMLGSLRQMKEILAQNHYRLSTTVGLPDLVTKLNPLRTRIATKIQKLAQYLIAPSTDKNVAWWRKKQQAMTKRKTSRKKNRFKKLNKKKEASKYNLSIPRLASSVVPANTFKGSTELPSTALLVKRFKKDSFSDIKDRSFISPTFGGGDTPKGEISSGDNAPDRGDPDRVPHLYTLEALPGRALNQKNMGLFKNTLLSNVYKEKGIWHRFLTKQFSKKKSNNLRRYKVSPKATGYGGYGSRKKPKYLNKDSSTKEEKQQFLLEASSTKPPSSPAQRPGGGPYGGREMATKLWTNPFTGTPFYENRATLKGLEGSIIKTRIKKRIQRRKLNKEKSSQKIYKYKRRKIQSAGKLRVLSKKLKTMKANLQLQTWWWQHFLPSYQAAIDAPWQVEKNRELQKIVSTHATTKSMGPFPDIQNSGLVTLEGAPPLDPVWVSPVLALPFRGSASLKGSIISSKVYGGGINVQDLKNYVLKNKSYKPLWFQPKHKILPFVTAPSKVYKRGAPLVPPTERVREGGEAYLNSLEKVNNTKQNLLTKIYENLYKEHLNKVPKGNALGEVNTVFGGYQPLNPLPFYAGWDESLRKFVVTNRFLSRRHAGFNSYNTNPFKGKKSGGTQTGEGTKSTQVIQFRKAPISGLNEGSFLYNKTDILFNTYAIEQFNGVSQSFYAPLGWRRFQFRHSILKRWFNNLVNLDTQQSKPLKPTSNITWLVKNKVLPSSVPSRLLTELRKSRVYNSVHYEQNYRDRLREGSIYGLHTLETKTQKIKLKKNLNRRTKKRYKILKDRQEDLNYQPTGSLLTEILPSHYLSIFDNQYRLPNSRYLRMPFIEFSKPLEVLEKKDSLNEQNKEQTNEQLRSSTFRANKAAILYNNFTATGNIGNSPDFTLRKRIKTKRKYHRKRNMPRGGLIFPRRRKFIAPLSNKGIIEGRLGGAPLGEGLDTLHLRKEIPGRAHNATLDKKTSWRPSSFRKASSATSSKTEKSKQKKRVKTNPSRLRQLRRRELQQVVKPNQRFQPRYGGFVWPGDYLRLELTDYPKLVAASLPSIEGKSNKGRPDLVLSGSSYDSKVTTTDNIGDIALSSMKNTAKVKLPTSLVGVLPRKYLLHKHNIKVLKKKLEKAQRSHKIHERTKQLRFYLSKNTTY